MDNKEHEQIERVLKHLSWAFKAATGEELNILMEDLSDGRHLIRLEYGNNNMPLFFADGDSPLSVIKDTVESVYKKLL